MMTGHFANQGEKQILLDQSHINVNDGHPYNYFDDFLTILISIVGTITNVSQAVWKFGNILEKSVSREQTSRKFG